MSIQILAENRRNAQAAGKPVERKPPVETVGDSAEVAGAILGEVDGVIGTADAGFEVAQEGVDPGEFGQVFRFARTDDEDIVTIAGVGDTAKAGQTIGGDLTAVSISAAQAAIAVRARPGTGVILAYRGCPSGFRDTAATTGTLFSEPRPAVPSVSSPPKSAASTWTSPTRVPVRSRSTIACINLCWISQAVGSLTPNARFSVRADSPVLASPIKSIAKNHTVSPRWALWNRVPGMRNVCGHGRLDFRWK